MIIFCFNDDQGICCYQKNVAIFTILFCEFFNCILEVFENLETVVSLLKELIVVSDQFTTTFFKFSRWSLS